MAREGIYVGGHEIVERYVGSNLVWSKFKFLFTANRLLSLEQFGSNEWTAQISNETQISRDIINNIQGNPPKKLMIKIRKNSVTYTLYASGLRFYTVSSGTNNYYTHNKGMILTFDDTTKRDEFYSFVEQNDTLDFYGKY